MDEDKKQKGVEVEEERFEPGPVFVKLRTAAFAIIMAVSFAWTVLLFVELYMRWSVSDSLQRGEVLVLSFINAGTVILLLVLIILPFRVWLDVARLALLIISHGGTALWFSLSVTQFSCPGTTVDTEATCRIINMYILLGSWVVPILLFMYGVCLTTAYYIYRRRLVESSRSRSLSIDIENSNSNRGSVLPFMHPPLSSVPSTTTQFLGPVHPSLPPPGPIYPSGPPPLPFYPSGLPPGPYYAMGSPTADRRMSTNRRISADAPRSISDTSRRTSSRPSRHTLMALSVAGQPQFLTAPPVERQRKDSMVSAVSEYSQQSRSSARVTLTKPIPLSKFEHAY